MHARSYDEQDVVIGDSHRKQTKAECEQIFRASLRKGN